MDRWTLVFIIWGGSNRGKGLHGIHVIHTVYRCMKKNIYIYDIRWYKQDCECMKGQKSICSVWWLPLDEVAKAKAKGKAKAKASAKAKAKTCCALDVVQVCSSKWIEMEGFKMFQLALPIGFLWSTHLLLKVFPIVFDAFRLIKPWNAEFEIGLCMPFWLWFLPTSQPQQQSVSLVTLNSFTNIPASCWNKCWATAGSCNSSMWKCSQAKAKVWDLVYLDVFLWCVLIGAGCRWCSYDQRPGCQAAAPRPKQRPRPRRRRKWLCWRPSPRPETERTWVWLRFSSGCFLKDVYNL